MTEGLSMHPEWKWLLKKIKILFQSYPSCSCNIDSLFLIVLREVELPTDDRSDEFENVLFIYFLSFIFCEGVIGVFSFEYVWQKEE